MSGISDVRPASGKAGLTQWTRTAFRTFSSGCVAIGTLGLAGWLLGFWSLVVRARIATGEWPQPRSGTPLDYDYRPTTIDPSAFGVHATLVWSGLGILLTAVPFVVIFLLASVPIRSMRADARLVRAFIVLGVLAGVTVFLNPGSFFRWFLD